MFFGTHEVDYLCNVYIWKEVILSRTCRKLKEQRRKQQEANVKRKSVLKEELREKSLAGMAKRAEQTAEKADEKKDNDDSDADDGDQRGCSFER